MSASPNFNRVASEISARASQVFQAHVQVTNEQGSIVASTLPEGHCDHGHSFDHPSGIRIPLRLEREVGELVVVSAQEDERIPLRLAQALVDLVIDEVAVAERLPSQPELKNRFVYDLLLSHESDRATVLREARLLGMDLSPPRAVILIEATDFISGDRRGVPDDPARRAQQVIRSVVGFFQLPNDTICAWNGGTEIAVLKASDSKNLESWVDPQGDAAVVGASWANLAALKRAGHALLHRLRHDTNTDIAIGLGRYHPGIGGLARSYSDARAALTLGGRFKEENRVHCLDGLGVAAFVGLTDESIKVGLAQHLLGPLDQEPELLQTLETFFAENCSQLATARRLSIHRNTLGYRLDKVHTLTGLDPRRFDDALQIRLALMIRAMAC